eukprot:4101811-Amphidinium_carterae.1
MRPSGTACVPGPQRYMTPKAKRRSSTHTHTLKGRQSDKSFAPNQKDRSTSRHSAVGRLNAVLLLINYSTHATSTSKYVNTAWLYSRHVCQGIFVCVCTVCRSPACVPGEGTPLITNAQW